VELKHLRTFLAAADALNISEAARRLRVTQPALSRQIKELESEIGSPLFVRRPNGLRLTEAGKALQTHGGAALAQVDSAVVKAKQSAETDASVLRVGYYSSLCVWANILGRAFEKLAQRFPKVTTQLSENGSAKLAEEVANGSLDAALLGPGEFAPTPGVVMKPACEVPLVAVMAANHRLAKKRQLSVSDLRDEPILGVAKKAAPGRDVAFVAACRKDGFTPRIAAEAASLPDLMVGLTQHSSLAVVDAFVLLAPMPGIAFVRFRAPELSVQIMAAYSSQLTPAGKLFVELTLAEAKRASNSLQRSNGS
jgi:DNA-binding transcriptional LysR family regulator